MYLTCRYNLFLPFLPFVLHGSPRAKVICNWTKADATDVNTYCIQTYGNFTKICIPPAIKCTNITCKSRKHRHEINLFYSQICEALHCSSLDSIPSSKSSDCRNYIVPGFNDYVKDLPSVARSDYVVWRDAGRPRSGTPCSNMRRFRLQLKGTDHAGTFMSLKCVVYYANYRSWYQSSKIQVVS